MDNALDFLGNKLKQGLSDVEQWGSDAGNDVTHALSAVFGGGSTPSAPTQQQQAPQQQNQQTFSQAQNPAIQLQANQPQQQNQQTPLKTNLFNPNQQNNSINIAGQPQNLNTKLVNFQQPTQPAIKLGGLPAAPIKQDLDSLYQKVAPTQVINTGRALGSGIGALTGALTNNPVATQNAMRASIGDLANGKGLISPQTAESGNIKQLGIGIGKGVAQTLPYAIPGGEAVAPEAAPLAKVGLSAGIYGGANAASTAAQQALTTGKVNLAQIAKSGEQGALMGGTGEAIHLGGEKAIQAVKDAPPLNEVGAVGKNVLSPEQLDEYSKLSPQEKAELPPKEQMALFEAENPRITTSKPELTDAGQQTKNQVQILSNPSDNPVQAARTGIGEAEGYADERLSQFQKADAIGSKLDSHDQKLLSELNDPSVKIEPHDPETFRKAVEAYDNAYDNSLATDRAGGGQTLKFGQHFTNLNFKVSEEDMDRLGIPQEQRYELGNGTTGFSDGQEAPNPGYRGFDNIQRKYLSYSDAAKKTNGILRPLYDSPVEDAKVYAARGDRPIRQNLVKTALAKTRPGEVSDNIGARDEEGKPFVQAAHGGLPFAVSQDLDKQLKNYRPTYTPDNKLAAIGLKAGEGAVHLSKKLLFLATPFHYANETARFSGATFFQHPVIWAKGLGSAIFSQTHGYNLITDAAEKDGTMDWIRKSGTPLPDATGKGVLVRSPEGNIKIGSSADISRPFNTKLSQFGNTLTISLARLAKEQGIDPTSDFGSQVGAEIGKVIGRYNDAVTGRDPNFSKLVSGGSLAPGWIGTSFGVVKDAAKYSVKPASVPEGLRDANGINLVTPGSLSRGAVLGTRAFLAGAAIIGTAIATGKYPTLKQTVNEAGLNPNNPVPNIEGNSRTKPAYKGAQTKSQVEDLVTDPFGLVVSLFSDPQHFASSRYSPFLASVVDAITNKNWNGEQLADPNSPNFERNRLTGAAKNLLPISVQNATNPNLSIKQGLAQDIGLRYKTNPNDPVAIANNQYYSDVTKATKGLNPDQLAAYNTAFPTSKDPSTGKYMIQPNVYSSPEKAEVLLANPAALQAADNLNKNLQSQGQKIDPFYNLPLNQQKAYLQYETINKNNTGQLSIWQQNNSSWAQPFEQARSVFYNSLPPGDPNKPQNPIQPPTQSQDVTGLYTQYDALTDPTQRADFLAANPSLSSYMNQYAAYTNQVLKAQGLAPLKPYPTTDPQTEAYTTTYYNASTADRTALRTGNPTAYNNMQNYLAQISEYDLDRQAGIDQLSSAPSQQYLKDAYNLGKYDIAKTGTGSTAQYSLNPQAAYAQSGSSGSGSSSSPPFVPLPKIKKSKKQSVKRPPKLRGFRAPHIKKSTKVNIQANGRLNPTKVLHPTQVVKIR